jgi:hypothetical protein
VPFDRCRPLERVDGIEWQATAEERLIRRECRGWWLEAHALAKYGREFLDQTGSCGHTPIMTEELVLPMLYGHG